MVEHSALVGHDSFQALRVELRVFPELLDAVGTSAEMHFGGANLHFGRPLPRFLGQARWAHNQILRLLKVLLGLRDEDVHATLTAEVVLFTIMGVGNRLLFSDSQPY